MAVLRLIRCAAKSAALIATPCPAGVPSDVPVAAGSTGLDDELGTGVAVVWLENH